ncbi:MAG TPA: hypothetical protein VK821_00760 [Dehalococcoidia bacterium]|nr:hypothetical protein [Dehalococcoidia bacterium]
MKAQSWIIRRPLTTMAATAELRRAGVWHNLRRFSSVLSIVALSVLTTVFVQHLLAPPRAAAQADQPQVVRASSFELVGADGTVLARLAPGPTGNGRLQLFDTAGKVRAGLAGDGRFTISDADGVTRRLYAGYALTAGTVGAPPINGIQLDPSSSISVIPAP